MSEDQKNLFLAMGLSLLVIITWQYFYATPKLEQQRDQAQKAQQASPVPSAGTPPATSQAPGQPAAPAAPGVTPTPAPAAQEPELTRPAALAASPRVAIDTKSLKGSIALKGGRIDDVSLKFYRETVEPSSPNITLLSPAGSPHPYYADTGFVPQPGQTVPTPKADTVWTADRNALSSSGSVTLTWDNGAGLLFKRVISVDDQYMFSVSDSVENKGAEPVTLFPYALVSRRGKPELAGYAVLHEGFVGIVGDSRVQEYTYDQIEKETRSTRAAASSRGPRGRCRRGIP